MPRAQPKIEFVTPIRDMWGAMKLPCLHMGLYAKSDMSKTTNSYIDIADDQPDIRPVCIIWTLGSLPGSLKSTTCTLYQGTLILFILTMCFNFPIKLILYAG